jgi:hypothetical protein
MIAELVKVDTPDIPSGDEKVINDVHQVQHVHPFNIDGAIDANADVFETAKQVIDQALCDCIDNAGVLGSPAFELAIKAISNNKALWFEYRTKIKAAKPAGVLMSDIDSMAGNQSGDVEKQDSTAAELIEMVTIKGTLSFDSKADKAFVSVLVNGVMNTLSIGSKSFTDWLSFSYYSDTGKSPSESAIKQANFALSGVAKFDGTQDQIYLRVADKNNGHYIFIGDDDRQVIEVLPTGWRVINESPIKFWMPSAMQALPIPIQGGDLNLLWDYVNIPEQDQLLVLAWILESFRANTPFPILALNGTQGSAKSSTQDKIRQLIDNNSVNLRCAPKTVEDVFVSAGCGWLVSYENLSHISPAMQDAFCTLATGGGFAARKLYTNNEENIIDVKRPIICNSIPSVLTAQDVTDRTITLELPSIAYREESEINTAWEKAKPVIFGGLLDLFVKTLVMMPKVTLVSPPRMADFTRLGEAMAQALGHKANTFDKLYKSNRSEGIGRALESSPVAVAVRDLVEEHSGASLTVFTGTMKALLDKLDKYKQESHAWPKSPRGLGDVLRRQQLALASLGINIDISKPKKDGIHVSILKTKGEYGEYGEYGFKDIHARRYIVTPLGSVAIDDSEDY